jgi:hypothetical protein
VRRIGKARVPLATFVAVCVCACACAASGAAAASREPVSVLNAALNGEGVELSAPSSAGAAARVTARASAATTATLPSVSSTAYGADRTEAVARILSGLDHGPELASQHVFVATPEEVAGRCGEEVIACYFPGATEMVVSGSGGARGGVPREFAIAHEYGHAIADSQSSPIGSAMDTGTIRWATYERVCQLSRAGVLFPGNQGGHYWQDPEEAFAETYAQLADPSASVPWQFSQYLAPTAASLAKVRADVARPWSAPTTKSWDASVSAPAAPPHPRTWGDGHAAISSARSLGPPSGTTTETLPTPLDGEVTVSLAAASSTPLAVRLVDPETGRTLARGATDATGAADLTFQNCGHESLEVQVRNLGGAPTSFEAHLTRP